MCVTLEEAVAIRKPEEYADIFGVEDFAAGFVRLEGNIILDFRIAWAMHLDTPGDTIIMGTKGSLRIPSTECWNGTVGGNLKLYQRVAGKDVYTEFPMLPPRKHNNFYYKMRTFLDAVKNGGETPVASKEIIINQAIIDAIVKSAKLCKEIEGKAELKIKPEEALRVIKVMEAAMLSWEKNEVIKTNI